MATSQHEILQIFFIIDEQTRGKNVSKKKDKIVENLLFNEMNKNLDSLKLRVIRHNSFPPMAEKFWLKKRKKNLFLFSGVLFSIYFVLKPEINSYNFLWNLLICEQVVIILSKMPEILNFIFTGNYIDLAWRHCEHE